MAVAESIGNVIVFLAFVLVFAFLVTMFIRDRDRKSKPYTYQVKVPEHKHVATVGRTVHPDRKPKFNAWQRELKRKYRKLSA